MRLDAAPEASSSSATPAIRVRGLTKRFGPIEALAGIDFDVPPGRIVGLLGPNGAGKTTTLHCLLGLTLPDAGIVEVLGLDLATHRRAVLARIGFSSAYVSMPEVLTVRENLLTYARLYGVSDPHRRIAELLALVELPDVAHRVQSRLSTGQLTRVNLVKALLHRPEVVLLDEPTASLDPDIADKVRSLIRTIQRDQQTTILYTSHNMHEVERLCDDVIFLNHGRIIARGSPAEITQRFGTASMEQFFVHVARGGVLVDERRIEA